jgi:Tol biopolymer transport system component
METVSRHQSWVGIFLVFAACAGSEGAPEDSPAVSRAPGADEPFLTNLQQITFEGQNAEAYFSSDGTRLIFQRTGPDEACDQQYTINLDGSEMRRVSNGLGRTTCGYFYENDQRIVYSSTFNAGETCPPDPDRSQGYVWPLAAFDVYTSLPDGSDLQRLTTEDGYDAEATLSPDGGTIVFTSTRDGDLDIYTMNTDGTNVRRLTSTFGYDGGPFFSPDGSKIIYRSSHPESAEEREDYASLLAQNLVRPSAMEIWVMNADGSEQHQVTDLGGANFAPFFHPDGERIIFSSNHQDPTSRNFDLFIVGLDGSNPVQVTTHGDFDGFPMFSPDGSKLVFASNRYGAEAGDTNIFIADWVER